jgi:hypothetical protein
MAVLINLPKCPKRGQKPGKLPSLRWTTSPFAEEKEKSNFLKMKNQSANVIEKKGPGLEGRQ